MRLAIRSIVCSAVAVLGICAVSLGIAPTPLSPVVAAREVSPAERRAVWIWGSTVRDTGAVTVAETLKARGITDAILLVKGNAGTLAYPSAIGPQASVGIDTLGAFLEACHARGIRVHAWLNFMQDDAFSKATGYQYTIWHTGKNLAPPYSMGKDGRICPLRGSEAYHDYFLSIVREILDNYPVDGIHLDYARYGHMVYCFCPQHRAAAEARGINVQHVRELINQTYYTPADGKAYFDALATGDPDVVGWVRMRTEEIDGIVRKVRQVVDEYNAASRPSRRHAHGGPHAGEPASRPYVALSAALMPEGALDTLAANQATSAQFALCHYAQSYASLAPMLSFMAPMAYHADYGKPASWVGDVVAGAVAKARRTPVLAGIQTYSTTADAMADALYAARWNGAAGFSLFRHGLSDSVSAKLVPTIETLIATAAEGVEAGWIRGKGLQKSLLAQLGAAQAYYEAGDAAAAAEQLGAFVHHVEAQTGRHIDGRMARILVADARWVIALLR